MPKFDNLQKSAFNRVNNLYAHDATWTPQAGGGIQTGKVLFADATDVMELSDVPYNPRDVIAEYFDIYFPGLLQSANANNNEVMVIEGTEYNVRVVRRKYDGRTQIAILEPR